jgi:hypothetical protein
MKNSPVGASDGWQPTRLFFCSNCNALYQLIKVEAGPENGSRVITCPVCAAPLPAREGKFVLKYFMLRKAARDRKQACAPARPRDSGMA